MVITLWFIDVIAHTEFKFYIYSTCELYAKLQTKEIDQKLESMWFVNSIHNHYLYLVLRTESLSIMF